MIVGKISMLGRVRSRRRPGVDARGPTAPGRMLPRIVLPAAFLLGLGGDAPRSLREVWMRHQDLYEAPYSFSRRVARVPQGTSLEVLEEGAPWTRVRVARAGQEGAASGEKGAEGWTVWRDPPRLALPAGGPSSAAASPASVALAVKAFERISEEVAELLPEVERAFGEVRDSWLDPKTVSEFARSGGLRPPEGGGAR
ncbi:MAG: hypothetical protein ACUVYA_20350 [Planctomycetota bacterium]